jgi:hypothetical protein
MRKDRRTTALAASPTAVEANAVGPDNLRRRKTSASAALVGNAGSVGHGSAPVRS